MDRSVFTTTVSGAKQKMLAKKTIKASIAIGMPIFLLFNVAISKLS